MEGKSQCQRDLWLLQQSPGMVGGLVATDIYSSRGCRLEPEVGHPWGWAPGCSLSGCKWLPSRCPHTVERQELSWGLFHKGSYPIHGAPILMTQSLMPHPKAPLVTPSF